MKWIGSPLPISLSHESAPQDGALTVHERFFFAPPVIRTLKSAQKNIYYALAVCSRIRHFPHTKGVMDGLQTAMKGAIAAKARGGTEMREAITAEAEDAKMKIVRLGCASLATIVILLGFLCTGPFTFHEELPRSQQTLEAIRADMANHTAESEALINERSHSDAEYNRWHAKISHLLTFFAALVVIWSLWWIASKGPFFEDPF